jgi:HPt (histidine-containing phosphotransfer) domain-containing protein
MSTSPIDRSRLDLITGGDEELLRELVELYLSDTATRLSDIESALAATNLEKIRRQAHAIKGASANMGATAMQEICTRLETVAKNESPDGIAELVAELREGSAAVARAFGR